MVPGIPCSSTCSYSYCHRLCLMQGTYGDCSTHRSILGLTDFCPYLCNPEALIQWIPLCRSRFLALASPIFPQTALNSCHSTDPFNMFHKYLHSGLIPPVPFLTSQIRCLDKYYRLEQSKPLPLPTISPVHQKSLFQVLWGRAFRFRNLPDLQKYISIRETCSRNTRSLHPHTHLHGHLLHVHVLQ